MRATVKNRVRADNHPVVRDLSGTLIRSRIRERRDTETPERAIRSEIRNGASIDALSEASGLTPEAIHKIVDSPDSQSWESNVAALAGIV